MGKSENYLFYRNYCNLRSQSCLNHSTKWVNEVSVKGQGHSLTLVKGHYKDFKVKTSFSQKQLCYLEPKFI